MVLHHIHIAGHTDSTGSAASNLALSAQRAGVVKSSLLKSGILSTKLSNRGYGEEQPLPSHHPESPQHRRVDLHFAGITGRKALLLKNELSNLIGRSYRAVRISQQMGGYK